MPWPLAIASLHPRDERVCVSDKVVSLILEVEVNPFTITEVFQDRSRVCGRNCVILAETEYRTRAVCDVFHLEDGT